MGKVIDEIMSIRPGGESKILTYRDDRNLVSLRNMCTYVSRKYHRKQIIYSTQVFPETNQLLITAKFSDNEKKEG